MLWAQALKWSVYTLLMINLGGYFVEEMGWARHTMPDDPGIWDYFKAYSTTLDQSAWMLLVFMFELETYSLPRRLATRPVILTLHLVRIICYFFVFYAIVGYSTTTWELYQTTPYPAETRVCDHANGKMSFQIPNDYVKITDKNCAKLDRGGPLYKIHNMNIISDASNLKHARFLGWLDIVNVLGWYVVLLMLEISVRLKGRGIRSGKAVQTTRWLKAGAYGVLIICLLLWLISGYLFYAWDAFLWLAGFGAIESNLILSDDAGPAS